MARGGPHMRAANLRRQEEKRVALNLDPVERVVRIRHPHAIGAAEHPPIAASAAAGARLDLDLGMRLAQPVDQPV